MDKKRTDTDKGIQLPENRTNPTMSTACNSKRRKGQTPIIPMACIDNKGDEKRKTREKDKPKSTFRHAKKQKRRKTKTKKPGILLKIVKNKWKDKKEKGCPFMSGNTNR